MLPQSGTARMIAPSINRKGQKAMAGSLDADARREQARVSLSPSCTWLSPLPRNR